MSEEATSSSQRQSEFTTSVAEIRAALEARLKELEKSIEAVDETATDARTLAFSGAEKNATNIEADVRPQSGAEASRAFRVVHRGCNDGTDYSNHVGVIEGQVFLDDVLVSEDSTAAFDFYDNSFAVTAETYGWIDLDMEDSEDLKWTMNVGATIPAADADHKIRALFHLPWDSTNSTIDAASVIRYHQGNVHFEAGGIDVDSAADGDILSWDATGKKWIKLTPVAVTVVTAVQYDISTHQDQIKTRSITALVAGAESAWTLPTGGQLVIES